MSPGPNDQGVYYPRMTAGASPGAGAFSSHGGQGRSPPPFASSPPPNDFGQVLCTEFVAPICVLARVSISLYNATAASYTGRASGCCWFVCLLARTLIAVFTCSHRHLLFIFMQAYGASATSYGGNQAYGSMPGGLHCKMPSSLLPLGAVRTPILRRRLSFLTPASCTVLNTR